MATEWFYEKDGEKLGPVSPVRLKELAASGKLEARDLVWKVGMEAWQPAARLRGLFQEGTTPPPLPRSTSDRPSERGAAYETSNPTQTPAAKLRAGIFEAAKRTARKARDVAGSDGVQETLVRAGRTVAEVGIKAKDAVQKAKEYATSEEAKGMVIRAKHAAAEAGNKVKDVAQKAKDYARSDEVQEAVGATRRHASVVGGSLAASLERLGDRCLGRWTRKQIAVASTSVGVLVVGLLLIRGGQNTGSGSQSNEVLAKDGGGGATASAARTLILSLPPGDVIPTSKPPKGMLVGERRLSPKEVIASIEHFDVSAIDYSKGPLGEPIVEQTDTDKKSGLQTTRKGYIGTNKTFVRHGSEIEWFGSPNSGKKKKEVFYFDGKVHGIWTEWFESGGKRVEMTHEKNISQGLLVEYYENGSLKKVYSLKNNRFDGPVAGWNVDQAMEYYRTYKDGKVNGVWLEWYTSGQVKDRCEYLNGKRHGIRTEFFSDGVIATESNYVAGALDGKLVERLVGRKPVTTNWSRGRIVFDRRTCNRRSFLFKITESDSVYSDPEGTHSTFDSVGAFLDIFGRADWGSSPFPSVADPLIFSDPNLASQREWYYKCSDGEIRLTVICGPSIERKFGYDLHVYPHPEETLD